MWNCRWDFNNHPINRAQDFEIFGKNLPRFTLLPHVRFPCVPFWHRAHVNENKYFPCVRRFYCLLDACLYKQNEWLLFHQLDLYVYIHIYIYIRTQCIFIITLSRVTDLGAQTSFLRGFNYVTCLVKLLSIRPSGMDCFLCHVCFSRWWRNNAKTEKNVSGTMQGYGKHWQLVATIIQSHFSTKQFFIRFYIFHFHSTRFLLSCENY